MNIDMNWGGEYWIQGGVMTADLLQMRQKQGTFKKVPRKRDITVPVRYIEILY